PACRRPPEKNGCSRSGFVTGHNRSSERQRSPFVASRTMADRMTDSPIETAIPQSEAEAAVRTLIRWAGDDPDREGLLDTPARVARSYRELFSGYEVEPREYLERIFEEVGGYDQLVVLKDIRFVSFCEHHMLPVVG